MRGKPAPRFADGKVVMDTFTLNVSAEPEHWEALQKVAEHLSEAFLFQQERVGRLEKGEPPRFKSVVPSSYTEAEKAAYYAGQKNAFEMAQMLMIILASNERKCKREGKTELFTVH